MHSPSESYLDRTEYTKRWQFPVLNSSRGGQATGGSPIPDVYRNREISLKNQPHNIYYVGPNPNRRLRPSISAFTRGERQSMYKPPGAFPPLSESSRSAPPSMT